ncbi:MAG: NYN domain-containing protein, partial [Candidatus Vogelbacteria bacterium]|nr:NYN domain-containing protein [Candidatus Vogelbacteria bacterium]
MNNLAFVDGQNLYFNTAKKEIEPWVVDFVRFRIYLEKKYQVKEAYYFLGCVIEKNRELYENLQKAGFIVVFRKHHIEMIGKKKGNVDSDIIFDVMRRLYKRENFDKIILVSGDGDYKAMIDFLIEEKRFGKILFPDKKFASSLYQTFSSEYFDYLENPSIKEKIEYKK